MQAQRRSLSDGRWHFQHGPIDLVLQCEGDPQACATATETAWLRFTEVLPKLVSELPWLRQPVLRLQDHVFKHAVAQRMHHATRAAAVATPDGFVTPMAAVAGAVAQEMVRFRGSPEPKAVAPQRLCGEQYIL